MKSYLMLQNAKITAFTISDLLKENKLGWWVEIFPPKLGLNTELKLNQTSNLVVCLMLVDLFENKMEQDGKTSCRKFKI